MRSMMFAVLLLSGCLDPESWNSDPTTDLGDKLVVHVTSPKSFDALEVTLPAFGNKLFDSRFVSPPGTEYTYDGSALTAGDRPSALSFTARLANVRIATGEVHDITYVTTENGDQSQEELAELAITLTAVGE